jgi:hypothetical protein
MNLCENTAVSPSVYAGLVPSHKTAFFGTSKKTFFVIAKEARKSARTWNGCHKIAGGRAVATPPENAE